MCGICGMLQVDNHVSPPEFGLAERMTNSLKHRGPDDCGVLCADQVALGSRRLAVIDLSPNGHQPMSNEDGTVWITYNGEVYNFRELKDHFRLVEHGHRFRSRTDTEVLVHLYEELGIEMVKQLNGMFAIAIWDSRTEQLHLIRDPFGIKPLFYQIDDQYLRFASEIKAILCDPRVPRRPSLQALHDFLTFDYIPGEQTAFEGIYEVPPAHYLTIDCEGHIAKQRYWDLPFNVDESIDEKVAIHAAFELMDQAVERQLIADVPVGVLLSGGLDSSAILALMRRHTQGPIHTYSVGFEDSSFNELPYARIVAQKLDASPHEVIVTPQLVRELLPKYLNYIDEPYADGSAIPTYYVCQLAKDEVVVVLSGEGGDEAFAGYDTYAGYQASKLFKRVPRVIRQAVIAPVVNALPVSEKKLSFEFRAKRFIGGQDLSPAQAHLWWRIVLTEKEKLSLYAPSVCEHFMPQGSDRFFIEAFQRSHARDAFSRLMHIDSSVFMPDDLMIKNDRMSMAHSLEARVPMTDPDLTEYMSRVPPRLKMPWLRKKHLMREALRGMLPHAILNKKKIGLEMPYSGWLKRELNDLLMDYLSPERLFATGLLRPASVAKLVDDHLAGRRDNARSLWGLMNYMMWHELYIS